MNGESRMNKIVEALLEADEDAETKHKRRLVKTVDRTIREDEEDDDFKEVYWPKQKYLPLGTIIRATMRAEDIVPAFLEAFKGVDTEWSESLKAEYESMVENGATREYIEEFLWERLSWALEKYVPPYTYLGPHPGDLSDYGVWVSDESIDYDLSSAEDSGLQSMKAGEPIPTGSKYVVVLDNDGSYAALLDGRTGDTIWNANDQG
jgi:hypothetical protein